MLLLKGCPRCHGDMLLVTYMDDRSTSCLQCGYSRELRGARDAEPRPIALDDERRRHEGRYVRPRLTPMTPRGA